MKGLSKYGKMAFFFLKLACVASVTVRSERNSGRQRSHSGRAKKGAKAKRWKKGGGGEERRERLPANPRF